MNKIVCEMCNSTEIIKQDGLFVCQHCGMKYSPEDAKKMMIEGTVDVSGTVKVDNSSFVEKYLANARRAYEKEDWDEVEKYYNMVEQNDPNNIEAIFYSAYAKAKKSLIDSDLYKRQAAFKVLQNCISIIDDNYSIENEEKEKEIITRITADMVKMVTSSFVYKYKSDLHGNTTSSEEKATHVIFVSLINEYIQSLKNIISKFDEKDRAKIKYLYMDVIALYAVKREMPVTVETKNKCNKDIVDVHIQIKAFEPDHEIPYFEEIKASKGCMGCYVATCVYGSYDCPQVWTLRRYRDNTLAATWYGRMFIRTYYALSPTIVKWFGKTDWFKKMWKGTLDGMVEKLNSKGVENTPYEDKQW